MLFLACPCSICKDSTAFQDTLRLAPGIAKRGADWQNTSDSGIWFRSTHSGSLLNTKLSGADIAFTSGPDITNMFYRIKRISLSWLIVPAGAILSLILVSGVEMVL